MAATTAFYGSLSLLKNSVQIIVDVDSRLTDLKKVMDQNTNFDQIMQNATESAKEFGKTLNEVLDAYAEFARQGYKQQDLVNLGNAGLITSNVGEMSSAQAAQYLTSALVQFNMQTKDSMKIIDAWNNVSNKNATTVMNLAQGMGKAGSTAHAFGLDMNQLNAIIGTVTAATKQSGDEVGNFVKSVLPRLTSKPAQDALKMLNVDFIDKKTGDMRNAMDIYADVADKVQNISKTEKAVVMEGLAGKYHISRMTALLDNFDMYRKMLNESRNSEGSAARENDVYMKSLTARIAIMKQSFEQLALIFGKAFLTEGFIQSLKGLESVAVGVGAVVKVVGGLPLVMTAGATATMLLSSNFQKLALESTLLQTVFTKLNVTSKLLKVGLASIGVAIPTLIIGVGIEFLLQKMGEARQKAEELATKNKELVQSYKDHKKEVQSLTVQYEELDKKIRNGTFDTKDIEKYKNISNELAKLMPDLVMGEDQYGNKILGGNEVIKAKIKLLEEQTAAQERLDAIQKSKDVQDAYDTAKKDLNSKQSQLNRFWFSDGTDFQNATDAYKRLDELRNKLSNGKKLSFSESGELKNLNNILQSYEDLKSEVDSSKLTYQKSIMDMIDNNVKLDSSTSKTTKSLINDFTMFVATSESSKGKITKVLDNVLNKVQNDNGFKKTLEDYSSAIQIYQQSINDGTNTKDLENYKKKAVNAFKEVKKELLSLAKEGKLDPKDINAISAQMDGVSNSALIASIDFDKLTKSTGKTKDELMANLLLAPQAEDGLLGIADGADAAASGIDGFAQKLADANGNIKLAATSSLSDEFKNISDKVSPLNKLLEDLANGKKISASEAMSMVQSEGKLADAFVISNGVVKVNKDAVLKLRDAYIASSQDKLKQMKVEVWSQSEGLKEKLKGYGLEIQAILSVAQANEALAKAEEQHKANVSKIDKNTGEGSIYASMVEDKQYKSVTSGINDIKDAYKQLDDLSKIASTGLKQVGTSADTASKSTDKATKSTEHSLYVADKYAQELDKINYALDKQAAIQKKYVDYSSQYQKSLKEELTLLEKKKSTLEAQAKALDKQIKSGNIQQTGVVTISGGGTGSQIWGYLKSAGFSDSAAAGIMGNLKLESGYSTTIVNPKSGATGIAQWLGSRLTNLKSYAKSQGTSWTDLNTQLQFLLKEFYPMLQKNGGISNFNSLNPTQAAYVFEKLFERSGGSALATRENYANSIYKQFKGTAGSSVSSSSSDASKTEADRQAAVDDAKSKLYDLKSNILDLGDQIQQKLVDIVNATLSKYDHLKTQLQDDYASIDLAQSKVSENSKEWATLEQKRIELKGKELGYDQQSIKILEDRIKNNSKLKADERLDNKHLNQLKDDLNQRRTDALNLEKDIMDVRINMAQKVLDTYKQVLEAQKQAALDAIDKTLAAIDKEVNDSQYAKEIANKQKAKQDILDQLNALAIDNSASALKQKQELTQQLQQADQDLQDTIDNHNIDLRKQNLSDQKDKITTMYDNIINDETKLGELRDNIIKGNISTIKKEFNGFIDFIKAKVKSGDITSATGNNLLQLIAQSMTIMNSSKANNKIVKFDTGGYTSDSEGIAYLHKKELILNKDDTSNILNAIKIMSNLANKISFPKLSNFNLSPALSTGRDTIYNINLRVDNLNGTKNDATTLLNEIVKGVKLRGGKI